MHPLFCAERNLTPSRLEVSPGKPGRADFVMLRAGEITGEIVTVDRKAVPPRWIAAATPEHRLGHNAAIELGDPQGHFRLKGIPANKPVVLTVNSEGNSARRSSRWRRHLSQRADTQSALSCRKVGTEPGR